MLNLKNRFIMNTKLLCLVVCILSSFIISCSNDEEVIAYDEVDNSTKNALKSTANYVFEPPYYLRPYNSNIPRVLSEEGILEIQDNYLASSIMILCPPAGHNSLNLTHYHEFGSSCNSPHCFEIIIQGYFESGDSFGEGGGPFNYATVVHSNNGSIVLDIDRGTSEGWLLDRYAEGNQIYIELRKGPENGYVTWKTEKKTIGGDGESIPVQVTYYCINCNFSEMHVVKKSEYESIYFPSSRLNCPKCNTKTMKPWMN